MGLTKEKMKADLELRRYAKTTQDTYISYAEKFITYFMRPAEQLGESEIRQFLLHLIREKKASESQHKVYVAALKYLYTHVLKEPEKVVGIPWPKVPHKLPDILSGLEVLSLLRVIESIKVRAIVTAAYGAGMRVTEACYLQTRDIDSQRMLIHIRKSKGNKERYVMLGEALLSCLRQYYRSERPQGLYLFPGKNKNRPISSQTVQQAVKQAATECGIQKKVTPHSLRHAFATHLLESGTDIRTIQVLLGHRSIRTTTLYTQVSQRHVGRVKSPLDSITSPDDNTLG